MYLLGIGARVAGVGGEEVAKRAVRGRLPRARIEASAQPDR